MRTMIETVCDDAECPIDVIDYDESNPFGHECQGADGGWYTYNANDGVCPVVCREDMDCWDCTTMGNLVCGDVGMSFTNTDIQATVAAPTELAYTGAEDILLGGLGSILLVMGLLAVLVSKMGGK